jgi:hypothetical protein
MSSKAETRAHNQKVRDEFWSALESLLQESSAPLEARDNSNQEATRKIFEEDGRSNFEHQAWRESEMLAEMIRLHQERYIKLNPQEQGALKASDKHRLSFEEHIRVEQEVDENGLTEADWSEAKRLIGPTNSRNQLETWAAENFLRQEKRIHRSPTANNEKTLSRNKNPELNYKKLMSEAVIVEGASKKKIETERATANRAINRALEGKNVLDLPIKIQNCGNLDRYQIIRLGEPKPSRTNGEMKISPSDCMYQKIFSKNED